MSDDKAILGMVLAGGRSSRFGGDKALARLGGQSLLARAVRRIEPQVAGLAINANAPSAESGATGLPLLADRIPGHAGPLAGILSGLLWAQGVAPEAASLVTVAVDTPFFPEDLVARLAAGRTAPDRPAMAASASGTHPTFALWPLSLAPVLAGYVESGGRKLHDFMRDEAAAIVAFPEVSLPGGTADPFFNINRREDLAEAERLLGGS